MNETNLEKLQEFEIKKANIIKFLETEDISSFIFYAHYKSYAAHEDSLDTDTYSSSYSPNRTYSLGMVELYKNRMIDDMYVPNEKGTK